MTLPDQLTAKKIQFILVLVRVIFEGRIVNVWYGVCVCVCLAGMSNLSLSLGQYVGVSVVVIVHNMLPVLATNIR